MLLPSKSSLMRRLLLILMARSMRSNPDSFLSRMNESLPEPDKLLLAQPELKQVFIDSIREAFRYGTRGAAWDGTIYSHPWGFLLQDISMEVHLWHGELDAQVPVSVGRYVANAIPNCRAKFLPDEGHLSLGHNYIQEILSVLVP